MSKKRFSVKNLMSVVNKGVKSPIFNNLQFSFDVFPILFDEKNRVFYPLPQYFEKESDAITRCFIE